MACRNSYECNLDGGTRHQFADRIGRDTVIGEMAVATCIRELSDTILVLPQAICNRYLADADNTTKWGHNAQVKALLLLFGDSDLSEPYHVL